MSLAEKSGMGVVVHKAEFSAFGHAIQPRDEIRGQDGVSDIMVLETVSAVERQEYRVDVEAGGPANPDGAVFSVGLNAMLLQVGGDNSDDVKESVPEDH